MLETVAGFYRDGGAFMHLILIVSVIGTAIVIERWYLLLVKFNVDGRALFEKVNAAISEGRMDDLADLGKDSDAPLLKLLRAGVAFSNGSEKQLQAAMDQAAMEIIPTIDRRIPYLLTLANISTLLGLLGTIQGLIQAFSAVGMADPSQKAALLANGISIALYTTFFGLMVAIPLLTAYTILQSKAVRTIDELDEFSIKFMNLLNRIRDGYQTK